MKFGVQSWKDENNRRHLTPASGEGNGIMLQMRKNGYNIKFIAIKSIVQMFHLLESN